MNRKILLASALALASIAAVATGAPGVAPSPMPWQSGLVFIAWDTSLPLATREEVITLARDAGAQHINLPVLGCQSDLRATDVGRCSGSTAGQRAYVLETARLARALGLSVSFLPIVVTPTWQWRGFFEPSDLDAWFDAYARWLEGVALDSNDVGATELVVASEMNQLFVHEARWRAVIARARAAFAGRLTLAANWDPAPFTFWDALDAIGVSSYAPLSEAAAPSDTELLQGAARIRDGLLAVSGRWGRPVHLTEVGYPSTTQAARLPWSVPPDAESDLSLQARCYEALTRAWLPAARSGALAKTNFWGIERRDAPGFAVSYDPLGKPAEGPLRRFLLSK